MASLFFSKVNLFLQKLACTQCSTQDLFLVVIVNYLKLNISNVSRVQEVKTANRFIFC